MNPKIKGTPDYLKAVDVSVFLHWSAVPFSFRRLSRFSNKTSLRPCRSLVELLLSAGAKLNEPFTDETTKPYYDEQTLARVELPSQLIISPWVLLMRCCIRLYGFIACDCLDCALSREFSFVLLTGFPLINLFLNYGADSNAEFWGPTGRSRTLECSKDGCWV